MRPNSEEIPYHDGSEAEILAVLTKATDTTVYSAELQNYIHDWPTNYHLSGDRANLLIPFRNLFIGKDVVEFGSGCGALTRYLGELSQSVLSLEATRVRAECVRQRCRDLQNVEVVSGDIFDFPAIAKFDFVLVVGALEYAASAHGGHHSHLDFLKRARSFLKPDGEILLAIENQFGLKYLCGAAEDHLGERYVGIENRYSEGGIRTFGLKELLSLFSQAGFVGSKVWGAYPDYKFPRVIVSEQGAMDSQLGVSNLLLGHFAHDPQFRGGLSVSPELFARAIQREGQLLQFANSFIVTARASMIPNSERTALATHMSSRRKPELRQTKIFERVDGDLVVRTQRGSGSRTERYHTGESLLMSFHEVIAKQVWRITDLVSRVREWDLALRTISNSTSPALFRGDLRAAKLPGGLLDAWPGNIVKVGTDQFEMIDLEVLTDLPVELLWIFVRGLAMSLGSAAVWGAPGDLEGELSLLKIICAVSESLDVDCQPEYVKRIAGYEDALQSRVIIGRLNFSFLESLEIVLNNRIRPNGY